MLSPSPTEEVCGADEGQYNTRAVRSQGAFDVQGIRASQTTDPRAKQTRPSGSARRQARVIQGLATATLLARHFIWEKWWSVFLSQSFLGGLLPPAAALPLTSLLRTLAAGG